MEDRGRKIIGIGETIMDIIFKNGKPTAAVPGGSTFNGIISLGRLGLDVSMISETGNDKVGDIIMDFMKDNGVLKRLEELGIEEGDTVTWVFTRKEKISKLSRVEDEREITEEEYLEFYAEASSELTKTRYSFPFEGHIMEIDVYPPEIGGPGLEGRAVLEVELRDEAEEFAGPDFLVIERELTGTKEFSNKTLARPVK